MIDIKVQETQKWLNTTYGGHSQWKHLDEDGLIGWQTIFGLIRGLQIELGISTLSDNFGDGTMSALKSQHPVISPTTSKVNVRRLGQSALWCHGFSAGFQWGTFDANTNNAIKAFSYGCGLAGLNDSVPSEITPKMLKALMTLDAYDLLPGGNENIREAQRWLNGAYKGRKMDLLPCDGVFTRSTQQGLMTAIQYELNMTDDQANGNFGPGTKTGLASNANLSLGSTDGSKRWVRLFQSALRLNGYTPPLNGSFDSATVTQTKAFQAYAELSGNGSANFGTWASLLTSTGDETRPGIACDMATQLSATYCAALYANGYRTVGRYLSVLGKRYAVNELDRIFDAGLKTFPIMQEANTSAADFSEAKGSDHGFQAVRRLRQLGFKEGTTVFFAVDFDALDDTITSRIIPYFRAVNLRMGLAQAGYKVGVYGTRNVCARVINAGWAEEAFIASMSWGWGGNLGFPLPPSWSYDQIRNHTLPGTSLEIDTNVQSSRARPAGRSDVLPTPVIQGFTPSFDEDYFWYVSEMTTRAQMAANSKSSARKIALWWLAHLDYNSVPWDVALPANFTTLESDACNVFAQAMPLPPSTTRSRMTHWAASTRGYIQFGIPSASSLAVNGDMSSWGLDLAQAYEDFENAGSPGNVRAWIGQHVGAGTGQFTLEDLVADIDAFLVARLLAQTPERSLDDAVREIEVSARADARWRFRQFTQLRFGGDFTRMASAAASVFEGLWNGSLASYFGKQAPENLRSAVGLGFADAIRALAEL